jgi:outer membrane immunogenic protein
MKRYALVAGLIAATFSLAAGSATAADLSRPVYKAPAYVPVPAYFSWTGFYAGVNAGYGWARMSDTAGAGVNPKGFIGGAQLGYNWQMSNFVFGVEADFQGSTQKESFTGVTAFGVTTADFRVRYFGTVRGRIGVAFDRALVYATGGYAYQNVGLDLTVGGVTASDNTTKGGYALGGGLEYAFAGPWSGRIEYLYLDTGNRDVTLFGITDTIRTRNNIVRGAINYRF